MLHNMQLVVGGSSAAAPGRYQRLPHVQAAEPFKCGLHLQPELQYTMSHSRDWDELQHVWTEWRRNTGRRIRDLYEQLVDLTNQAARLNNFTDASAYWMFPYESFNMRQEVDEISAATCSRTWRHVGSELVWHRAFYLTVPGKKTGGCNTGNDTTGLYPVNNIPTGRRVLRIHEHVGNAARFLGSERF
ncbi:unnamed protein product [Leptidea sinapis]|uniref:Uncharacterized protein n=1 Tax=Leptidea sinapis TaxID=189913 RepID=A0A5E4QJH0_9NEOP|nr:unnamed protein product [Leptidea sinapis]